MTQKTYAQTFFSTLKGYSIDKGNCKKEWKYIGGLEGRHLKKLVTTFGEKYYEVVNIPTHSSKCICGHHIEEQCYIQNIHTKEVVVVGNCCIKKFLGIDTSSICQHCGNKNKSRKDSFCSECRGGILNIGKFSGKNSKSYRYIMLHDPEYCRWAQQKVSSPSGKLLEFVEFLRSEGFEYVLE